jgi:hypothetical protein
MPLVSAPSCWVSCSKAAGALLYDSCTSQRSRPCILGVYRLTKRVLFLGMLSTVAAGQSGATLS